MSFSKLKNPICSKSELNFFGRPPVQVSIESSSTQVYRPVSSIAGASAFDFVIPPSDGTYSDVASTKVYVKCRVLNATGDKLTDTSKCSIVNLPLQSMFKRVDWVLNGTSISSNTPGYPYRAMFETLLSYDRDTLESQMEGSLFYRDQNPIGPVEMDDHDPLNASAGTSNKGLQQRYEYLKKSRTFDMIGRLVFWYFSTPPDML